MWRRLWVSFVKILTMLNYFRHVIETSQHSNLPAAIVLVVNTDYTKPLQKE